MAQRMTSDDFFTGLFAALALRGHHVLTLRAERFDQAIESIVDELMKKARANDIDVRFRVRLHPIHGDSQTVRDALASAAQRDLISFDNPEYQDIRLRIGANDAKAFLDTLPGGVPLFDDLAIKFLRSYV
jgi:hypothetical protein